MTGTDFEQVRRSLRASYDDAAARRDQMVKADWKVAERAAFLRRLQDESRTALLEVGAGTGQDSVFFAAHGLTVMATDLSAQMVARCQAKGLDARIMDVSNLEFADGVFDAVYAMNCLLHVPNADLPGVLAEISRVLRPGGLFFLGVYGGTGTEGAADPDGHVPARFFSWRTDEQIVSFAREHFDLVDFHVVATPGEDRFQSLTLRRADSGPTGTLPGTSSAAAAARS